ncbi:MAG: aminoacetone oxidase family FAD-binding enzyme, partial [Pseudomonadota bacterium]
MTSSDVLIIGGGAAGLFCAFTAARRGHRVRVLEGSNRIGKKILMSGGGRCNFTHLHSTHENFLSDNPHFCRSALARYTPYDFLELVERHDIDYVAKTPGQLFCRDSSKQIVQLLATECASAGVTIETGCRVTEVTSAGTGFRVSTEQGHYTSGAVVIASGGLSIPKMGASDIGYRIARHFGLEIRPTRAALVPFTFTGDWHTRMARLKGVSFPGRVTAGGTTFSDGLLFTHRGLSGPAALQVSTYWREGQTLSVELLPDANGAAQLLAAKRSRPRRRLASELAVALPKSLANEWLDGRFPDLAARPMAELRDEALREVGEALSDWSLLPSGTEGYRTAEVTLGGVDTHALD